MPINYLTKFFPHCLLSKYLFSEIRDKLRLWREDNVRQSSNVIKMWDTVLQDKITKFGDERKYDYHYNVCYAYSLYSTTLSIHAVLVWVLLFHQNR